MYDNNNSKLTAEEDMDLLYQEVVQDQVSAYNQNNED